MLGGREFGGYACYLRDGDRVFETYWSTGRGTEAGANSYHLLDLTVYGRQETWEESPEGWPQPYDHQRRRAVPHRRAADRAVVPARRRPVRRPLRLAEAAAAAEAGDDVAEAEGDRLFELVVGA